MKKKLIIISIATYVAFICMYSFINFNSYTYALMIHVICMIFSSIALLFWIKKDIEKQKTKFLKTLTYASLNVFIFITLYYLTVPILWSVFGDFSICEAYRHVLSLTNLLSYLLGFIVSLLTSLLMYIFLKKV